MPLPCCKLWRSDSLTFIFHTVKRTDSLQLAKEAFEVEEKEEKLVHETVKHLSEANVQISYLSEEFSVKSDESRKQKEEITHLLAQVIYAVLPTQEARRLGTFFLIHVFHYH